jgi:putative ATPase
MDIFENRSSGTGSPGPLAERMRPRNLSELIGHGHLAGEKGVLRRAAESDRLFSMILWGPPGCGKTTLARILARETRSHFIQFSAVLAGVKEIRSVIGEAGEQLRLHRRKTILFVDEIHRFNKAQQDAFLHHVESGLITLIGATTENPSFEVIPPLLSRCRVVLLKSLSEAEIGTIIDRGVRDKERGLGSLGVELTEEARRHLIRTSEGDGRTALNSLEIAASLVTGEAAPPGEKRTIALGDIESALQRKALRYDKSGEEHYNLISAFHKSLRGSDPDASLYWLCRMLASGEDPLFVARRMIRFASEDIGSADPMALRVALDAAEAFRFLGPPEGELSLAQAAVYLATAPKSNSVHAAERSVREAVETTGALPVPLHIRNAPTALMKNIGYGKDYRYAHDYPDAHVAQNYLPEEISRRRFYFPSDRGYEEEIGKRLEKWRSAKPEESGNPPGGKK